MKLLTHICCAPCALAVKDRAARDGFDTIAWYFHNPNIQPSDEFDRRMKCARDFCGSENMEFIESAYMPEIFFNSIREFSAAGGRCRECWSMRIDEAARYAKNGRFDAFTTTLLASPYQDHGALKGICRQSGERHGADFYYADFRTYFREAHYLAKSRGLYC
ncbi:MAG: epoxyqueuosine reductase QueH, partial [Candidatus Omnitrophota bacterium]